MLSICTYSLIHTYTCKTYTVALAKINSVLMLGKTEGNRRRGWQRMRWLDSISDPMHMNLNNIWEIMKEEETGAVLQYMRSESRT